jgi:RNA polymerase sigma-70 factor (ECF subfamily)
MAATLTLFAQLMHPLYVAGHRLAASILLNSAEAEDALQDATARAWRRLGSLRDPEKLAPWFYSIVVNEARRRSHSPWRLVLARGLRLDPAKSSREAIDARDLSEVVRHALLALDVEQRTVVVLRHYHDLRVEDIAAQLNVPVGTVKSRLSRATDRLRHTLTALEVVS